MIRVLKFGYLSVVALLVTTFALSRGAPKDPPKAEGKTDPIYLRLDKVVTYHGLEDPKVTLAEALEALASQHDLVFEINERAFKTEGLAEVAKVQPAETTPLVPMKAVRLETVLRKLLARVPSQSGATFTIRRDHIEITTAKAQQEEFWPNAPAEMEPVFPLIHAKYDKKPLDEALADLAERTDISIVLDTKAFEKEKPVVSARLTNTPLDTAVQLLAEMSDLRSVAIGKTLFVTTVEKAKRLEKQINPAQPGMPGMPPFIGAIGQIGQVGFIGVMGQPGGLGAIGQPASPLGALGALGAFGMTGATPALPGNFRPRSGGAPGAAM
jgi:hypothetical protein